MGCSMMSYVPATGRFAQGPGGARGGGALFVRGWLASERVGAHGRWVGV